MIKREEDLWFIYSTLVITLVVVISGLTIAFNRYNGLKMAKNGIVLAIAGEPNRVDIQEYRLTHYYTGDPMGSGKCTASGLCTNKFQVNSKGWYTYKGKLVVAMATKSYLKYSKYGYSDKIIYRKLWDLVEAQIDGVWYEAIVLDVCGKSMQEQRIDLFVSGKDYGIDRKVVYVK